MRTHQETIEQKSKSRVIAFVYSRDKRYGNDVAGGSRERESSLSQRGVISSSSFACAYTIPAQATAPCRVMWEGKDCRKEEMKQNEKS